MRKDMSTTPTNRQAYWPNIYNPSKSQRTSIKRSSFYRSSIYIYAFLVSIHIYIQILVIKVKRFLSFQEAVPLDCWISNSCSAIMIQESASRGVRELLSLPITSLGELSTSAVHWISGTMPTWSISWRAGDKYFATVMNKAEPSWSSVTLCNKQEHSFWCYVLYRIGHRLDAWYMFGYGAMFGS